MPFSLKSLVSVETNGVNRFSNIGWLPSNCSTTTITSAAFCGTFTLTDWWMGKGVPPMLHVPNQQREEKRIFQDEVLLKNIALILNFEVFKKIPDLF